MTDDELEVYFRHMNDLFRMQGWGLLLEDLKLQVPNIDSVEQVKTIEDLYFRKGQLYVISTLLNLGEHVRDAYDRLGDDPDASL